MSSIIEHLQQRIHTIDTTARLVKAYERSMPTSGSRPAVVFATIVIPSWSAGLEESKMLFIKRSSNLRKHPGQVGFPGGVVDPGDASLLDAGFREAKEEVAMNKEAVKILYHLPSASVHSGYHIHPYLVATTQSEFIAQPSEVEEIHLISLSEILSCPFRVERRKFDSTTHRVVYFDLKQACVWGITGGILERILRTFFDWSKP